MENIRLSKQIVNIMGFGLGNLIYRIYKGNLNFVNIENKPLAYINRRIKGTNFYILGGSIGTNGYTKVILPLIAQQQIKHRFLIEKRKKNKISNIRFLTSKIDPENKSAVSSSLLINRDEIHILVSNIESANAGALGAFYSLRNYLKEIQKNVQEVYDEGKIPLLPLIDIGGTKINFVLAYIKRDGNLNFKIYQNFRFPTPKNLTPDEFYYRLTLYILPILSGFNSEKITIIPFLGVGHPGFFEDFEGEIIDGAKDLGCEFIHSIPSEVISRNLIKQNFNIKKVCVCNDGVAQFYGLLQNIFLHDKATWDKIEAAEIKKIMYLGIGTGLGGAHGEIINKQEKIINLNDININLTNELSKLYGVEANDELEKIDESQYPFIPKRFSNTGYKFTDLVSSKFIIESMHLLDNNIESENIFIRETGLDSNEKNTIKNILNSERSDYFLSPLNPKLLNKILEQEIIPSKTECIIDLKSEEINSKLKNILEIIQNEISITLKNNVTNAKDSNDKRFNYNEIINEIIKVKNRDSKVHFVGIGKSHSIGQNLAYIYNNLGISSSCLELTGANSENLTNLKQDDLIILVSNSGEACELIQLIKYIKKKGCVTVAITGNKGSTLARNCDFIIDSSVNENPMPNIPEAPTTSTISALAIGTTIAIVTSYFFDYDKNQFYLDHPYLEFEFEDFKGIKADYSFDINVKIKDIFETFGKTIRELINDSDFNTSLVKLVQKILVSYFQSRTIFLTGTGASLRVAEKIAATMTSIGIDAVAVNSVNLPHGDFAHIKKGDLLIIISYSAKTVHLYKICEIAISKHVEVALITSSTELTFLTEKCSVVVKAKIKTTKGEEFDESLLVPIPDQKVLSSFINLTIGDALAVILAEIIEASRKEFAEFSHPGGEINRKDIIYDIGVLSSITDNIITEICNIKESYKYVKEREHLLRWLDKDLRELVKLRLSDNKKEKKYNVLKYNVLKFNVLKEELHTLLHDHTPYIIFGMGAIGLAYIGLINKMINTNKNIIFIEKDKKKINEFKKMIGINYTIKCCSNDVIIEKSITGVEAISLDDIGSIIKFTLKAEIIFVAIGVNNIISLAPIIAYITKRRYRYRIDKKLNFIINENFPVEENPLAKLHYEICKEIDTPEIKIYFDDNIGLETALDEAIVPEITSLNDIRIEKEYPPIYIDEKNWKKINNLSLGNDIKLVKNFYPLHIRKLWLHNMAHALIGYVGWYLGFKNVYDAISNKIIYGMVKEAMNSVGNVLCRRWDLNFDENGTKNKNLDEYINWRINKYKNKNLGDKIYRLCRDPGRKLTQNERLIGPLNFIYKYSSTNKVCYPILIGIYCAIEYLKKFPNNNEKSTDKIQKIIDNLNIDSRYLEQAKEIINYLKDNNKNNKLKSWENLKEAYNNKNTAHNNG